MKDYFASPTLAETAAFVVEVKSVPVENIQKKGAGERLYFAVPLDRDSAVSDGSLMRRRGGGGVRIRV